MAGYNSGTKYSGGKNQTASTASVKPTGTATVKVENLFSTGLWLQEKGPALASVQVKEDVTFPAGSYINLYQNSAEDKKTAAHPDFKITVRPGKLKPRA